MPPFFAQRLSFPEPVTQYNHERMRQLVLNGAHNYPGAVAVEDLATGHVITLANQSAARRELFAKQLLVASTARSCG